MKKKVSPFTMLGTYLVALGIGLNILVPRFADGEYGWVSIPVLVLALILLVFGLYKTIQEKK